MKTKSKTTTIAGENWWERPGIKLTFDSKHDSMMAILAVCVRNGFPIIVGTVAIVTMSNTSYQNLDDDAAEEYDTEATALAQRIYENPDVLDDIDPSRVIDCRWMSRNL